MYGTTEAALRSSSSHKYLFATQVKTQTTSDTLNDSILTLGVLLRYSGSLRMNHYHWEWRKKKLMLQGKIRFVMELPLHRPFSQVTVVFLRSNANKGPGATAHHNKFEILSQIKNSKQRRLLADRARMIHNFCRTAKDDQRIHNSVNSKCGRQRRSRLTLLSNGRCARQKLNHVPGKQVIRCRCFHGQRLPGCHPENPECECEFKHQVLATQSPQGLSPSPEEKRRCSISYRKSDPGILINISLETKTEK